MSQSISSKMQNMLDLGYQVAPQARLKVDIDPPFVGSDFMVDVCDPSLHEWNGVLYLTFIDSTAGAIKIGIVDPTSMKVTSLLRTISAASARRPRLVFEPSTFAGKPDLPHIAYDDTSTKKAMVYRETYDAQGNIVIVWDEIGDGHDCETVRMGNVVIDFYIGNDGNVYSRLQGEYAETFIDTGEEITSLRIILLPDCRFAALYTTSTQLYVAFSELFGNKSFEESFSVAMTAQAITLPKTVFYFSESFMAQIGVSGIELLSNLINLSESFYTQIDISNIVLAAPLMVNESFYGNIAATGILLTPPLWVNESFYVSLNVLGISLI